MANEDSIIVRIGADITEFSRGMAESQRSLNEFGNANKATFDAFKKTGAAVTGAGVALSAGLGTAVKIAEGFESGMSSVAAISGAVGEDLDTLTNKAREMGSATSFSATDAAKGLEYMALAGWSTQQMLDGISPILHLAEAGTLDLGRASDLVTDSMAALGLQTDDLGGYLDKVAQTSRKSNTDIDALMEAMVIAGGTFSRFNVPLEEANAFLGVLANRGTKGSEAGTALNAIMDRMTSGTGQAAKGLKEIGVSAFDTEGNFRGMEATMRDVREKLSGMTDEQKAHYQSMIAGLNHGKSFEKMMQGLGEEYDTLKADIISSDGALLDMRNTMKDNLQGALENLSSAFEEIAISIGTALIPAVKDVVAFVQAMADKFNAMSDSTKTAIAVSAAVAAALMLIVGPLLLLVGFIPMILSGFAAIGTVLAALITPIGLAVLGVAALAVGIGLFAKNMAKDAIPEVDRFGKEVSKNTKDAVGAFMDLTSGADTALKEMAWSQQTVTKQMADDMKAQQKAISDSLLGAIKERQTEELASSKEQLSKLASLSDEQKNAMITKVNERYAEEQAAVTEGTTRINEINQLAADGNRAITTQEADEILAIRQSMTEQAIVVMSESEVEQKMILERMRDNASTISAEEAAEVVRNSTEKKNGVVDDANSQYDETYKWALRQRDELGTLSADEAKVVIDEASKKRNKVVMEAESMHGKVVEEAKAQAGEHIEAVNWETGEILSKWEVFANKHSETWDKIKSKFSDILEATKKIVSEAFDTIKETVEKIVKEILDFVKPELDKFKVFWDENGAQIVSIVKGAFDLIMKNIKTGMNFVKGVFEAVWPIISGAVEIAWGLIKTSVKSGIDLVFGIVETVLKVLQGDWEGAWDTILGTVKTIWGNIEGFFEGVNLIKIGEDIIAGLIKGISSMVDAVGKAITDVTSAITGTVKKILQIKSPSRIMKGIGKNIGEGLVVGMDDELSDVARMAQKLADASVVDPSATAQIAGYQTPVNSSGGSRSVGGVPAYGSGETSRGITQNIAIHSPTALSPSEVARKTKQASQQLALEWR